MRLHGYWRSSCTYRVRIALHLKELPFEVVPVHLLKAEHTTEGYASKNPQRQVPTLEVDGVSLAQSVAILEYLEETHPTPALLPSDPVARARARQLTEIVNSGIQPFQNIFTTRLLEERGVDVKEWCVFHIRRGLQFYQDVATQSAGEFSVGDAPTFAECALVPQLYNARRFGIDVAGELPLLHRIDERCARLDAFAAAHPDRQPDAQPT